jgi:hypothetical protein
VSTTWCASPAPGQARPPAAIGGGGHVVRSAAAGVGRAGRRSLKVPGKLNERAPPASSASARVRERKESTLTQKQKAAESRTEATQPALGLNPRAVAAAVDNCWGPLGAAMDHCNETGFINSQPSMAEFMTHLAAADRPDTPPFLADPQADGRVAAAGLMQQATAAASVPEYPWMKEKKTTRKNSAQGECLSKYLK